MSSLNLVPNPAVFLVQAGLFVANIVAVKKLMLDPYLKVKAARDAQTVGNRQEAQNLTNDGERKFQEITERLQSAADEARGTANSILGVAQQKRDEIMSAAEKAAHDFLDQSQQSIAMELKAEREKVPAVVSSLSQVLFEKTVN